MNQDLLTDINSSFEPFEQPKQEVYVDCKEVRGKWDVLRELGGKIILSKKPTCQLYIGHRGVGKSTELLQLKDYLEQQRYFVVYFAADEQDIEPQDAEYADILFACTRHLVEAIKLKNHNPLLNWMKDRWESLKDLALTEVSFGEPSNYDEIYLNRSEMLRGLKCHVIYTVPISMVYSERATQLEDNYDKPDVLPMVMVRNLDGSPNPAGLGKFRELITKRI